MSLEELYASVSREIRKIFFGHDDVVDFALAALFSRGHVLLEGVPGTAKTLLVRTMAGCLDMKFGRVQMTPDLLPNDVTGSSVYRADLHRFEFCRGPIFVNFLLADEINRASAKTQSALLEAMQEQTVTHDGVSHELGDPFIVFATQNPVEQEGTYPLPLAELDRFMFKIVIEYPSSETEEQIYTAHHANHGRLDARSFGVSPVVKPETVLSAREIIARTHVRPEVITYARNLIFATRNDDALSVGGSPRAGLMLIAGAKSLARFAGRDFVIPDDVKRAFRPALRHRVVLGPAAELDGATPDDVLGSILENVEVPR